MKNLNGRIRLPQGFLYIDMEAFQEQLKRAVNPNQRRQALIFLRQADDTMPRGLWDIQ